ncbi:DUF3189 family protein [Syntrophomonas erecta]
MKIIFIANTGVHHALVAAYIYMNRIDHQDRLNTIEGYGDMSLDASGFPIYIGTDDQGNQIYTLGVGKDVAMGQRTLEDLRALLGCSEEDLLIKPVFIDGSGWLDIVAGLPHFMGGHHINRYVSSLLVKRHFDNLCQQMRLVKAETQHKKGKQPLH